MLRSIAAAAASRASALLRTVDKATVRLTGSPLPKPGAADPFAGLLPWELTTKAALDAPLRPDGALDAAYSALLLDFAGVCSFRGAVDPELITRCRAAADELTAEVRELVRDQGIDPDDPSGFSFRGAHQRDPGRMDVRNHYKMDVAPFDDPQLNDGAAWMPLVERVLGDDACLLWKGLVVTEPGTDEQDYHPGTRASSKCLLPPSNPSAWH